MREGVRFAAAFGLFTAVLSLSAADRAVLMTMGGKTREVAIAGTHEADGAIRYVLPAAEAHDMKWVEFRLDRAMAKKGEDGFWMGGARRPRFLHARARKLSP